MSPAGGVVLGGCVTFWMLDLPGGPGAIAQELEARLSSCLLLCYAGHPQTPVTQDSPATMDCEPRQVFPPLRCFYQVFSYSGE